jgi:hypothetical protein
MKSLFNVLISTLTLCAANETFYDCKDELHPLLSDTDALTKVKAIHAQRNQRFGSDCL